MALYPPTVKIGIDTLSNVWDGTNRIGLSGLKITWGRKKLFDQPGAATLEFSVIDPDGNWATDNSLSGAFVEVSRPGRYMFRGTVEGIKSTRRVVVTPDGEKRAVYVVSFRAYCKLADLAQARPPAPAQNMLPELAETYGGFWRSYDTALDPEPLQYRIQQLAANSNLLQIVSGVQWVSTAEVTSALGISMPRPPANGTRTTVDRKSLLELLYEVYACLPLAHVNYNAGTDAIQVGRTAEHAGMALSLSGGLVVSAPVSGMVVDASKVILPDRYPQIESTVSSAIDVIQTAYQAPNIGGGQDLGASPVYCFATTQRGESSSTNRVLEIASWFNQTYQGSDTYGYGRQYAQALAERTAELVDDVNEKYTMPPVRMDYRRLPTGNAALDDVLLDTKDQPVALFFLGSILNGLQNFAPQFQLIGGTLEWHAQLPGSQLDAGWTVDMNLAPATGSTPIVSIADLVTNGTPALSDFDPTITLADLGYVTDGLD